MADLVVAACVATLLSAPVRESRDDWQMVRSSRLSDLRGQLGPRDGDAVVDRIVLDAVLDAHTVRAIDLPEGKRLALSPPTGRIFEKRGSCELVSLTDNSSGKVIVTIS